MHFCSWCGCVQVPFHDEVCIPCRDQDQENINRLRAEQAYWGSLSQDILGELIKRQDAKVNRFED